MRAPANNASVSADHGPHGWQHWLLPGLATLSLIAALLGVLLQSRLPDIDHVSSPFGPGAGSWWANPYERNRGNRTVLSADLHAIAASGDNNRQLWAVGAGPVILHSPDAGVTWRQQYPAADAGGAAAGTATAWLPLPSAAAAPTPDVDTERKDKAGPANSAPSRPISTRSGPLRAASDPAIAASSAASGPISAEVAPETPPVLNGPTLLAVHADRDGRNAWAVGTGGMILHTEDGEHWAPQDSETTVTLRGVAFWDERHGWAVGDEGIALITGNAGRTWKRLLPHAGSLHAVKMSAPVPDNTSGIWVAGGGILAPQKLPRPKVSGAVSTGSSWVLAVRAGSGDADGHLRAIHLSPDGLKGWATSANGSVWRRNEGDWQLLIGSQGSPPVARGLAPTGNTLWMAGDEGLVRASAKTLDWERMPLRPPGPEANGSPPPVLNGIVFADERNGWIVGAGGGIWGTHDAGSTWYRLSRSHAANVASVPEDYRHLPAPWTALALIAGLGLISALVAFGRWPTRPHGEAPGASPPFPGMNSDIPLRDKRGDRLGHALTVEALSRFIRNAETDPQLTIAVTAPWGRGKSSIMRMLQTELEAANYRTAWFNAWHHQQEGKPLSALFNVIAQQAVPGRLLPRLRLRVQLIWRRGLAYRVLVVVSLAILSLLLVDAWHRRGTWQDLRHNIHWTFTHYVLNAPHVVLTDAALDKLNPCGTDASKNAACDPCPTAVGKARALPAQAGLPPDAYCYAAQRLRWRSGEGLQVECRDTRTQQVSACVFPDVDALLDTLQDGSGQKLSPAEKKAVTDAAEALPAPQLFPFWDKPLSALALVLGLLLTKGVTVYGLELLKPLRSLLSLGGRGGTADAGKEATGVIEKYRTEFGHLSGALHGKLVVFIDDLDRCTEAMVNSVLEMSNYLTDVGECFIVLGADLQFVKQCIKAPGGTTVDDAYASRYLRKLVHIEVPVPLSQEAHVRELYRPPAALQAMPSRLLRSIGLVWRFRWALLVGAGLLLALLLVMRPDAQRPRIVADSIRSVAGETSGALAAGDAASAVEATVGDTGTTTLAVLPDRLARPPAAAPSAPSSVARVGAPARMGALLAVLAVLGLMLGAMALTSRGRAFLARRWRSLRARVQEAFGVARDVHDPELFRKLLELWHQPVFMRDGTPRGTKRFRNKARFFGTLLALQVEPDESRETVLLHAVAMTALNFIAPGVLSALADGRSIPLNTAASAEDADLYRVTLECLRRHQSQVAEPITRKLAARYLALAGSVEVR